MMIPPFNPSPWIANSHTQTLWRTIFRPWTWIDLVWERIELPDGDFIDVVWDKASYSDKEKPIIPILPGLESDMSSAYAKPLLKTLTNEGYRPVFVHYRGCSGIPNRQVKAYHSGQTEDIANFVAVLHQRYPGVPIIGLGISLGANILLKWFGETGRSNPLQGGVAVSVPFLLKDVSTRFQTGFARFYQWWLLRSLKMRAIKKMMLMPYPLTKEEVNSIKTIPEFDDKITAPLHGFPSVDVYYEKASCRQYLQSIMKPVWIIHSVDDPFMYPSSIPFEKEMSPSISYIFTEYGGHLGFVEDSYKYGYRYWLNETIPLAIQDILLQNS